MEGTDPLVCRRCNAQCAVRYDYDLELESGTYPVRWFRCPVCSEEYLRAPDLLLPEDTKDTGEPGLGPYRKVALCHAGAADGIEDPGGRSVGALVATALAEAMVDAVLLPDFGFGRAGRVVTDPEEATGLRRAWSTSARSMPVNARLGANLDFLVELERFGREDRGAHPRIAVAGRPCQVYAARHANLARIAPAYKVPLTIGLFCYGNVSPSGSPALRFEELTGVAPAQIRGMAAADGKVRVASADGHTVEVPLREFESFLHKSCMKCVDFTAPFADLSLGEDPRINGFDIALVRTMAGERLWARALETGRLRTWSPPWMEGGGDSVRILSDLTRLKRDLAQMTS